MTCRILVGNLKRGQCGDRRCDCGPAAGSLLCDIAHLRDDFIESGSGFSEMKAIEPS